MTEDTDSAKQYPFTKVYKKDDSRAKDLHEACVGLARLGQAGAAAADRIHTAGENIAIFTPANLQAFIDVEGVGFEVEREHAQARSIQWVTILRNICVLLPLMFTWAGLSWATSQYALDLEQHKEDASVSFLQLWQEGFGARNSIFAFSHFALVDVILFAILIVIGVYADVMVRSARKAGQEARDLANQSFKSLVEVSITVVSGVNIHTTSQEWAGQVHQVLLEVAAIMEHMERLLSNMEAREK